VAGSNPRLARIPTIDRVLEAHAASLGRDFTSYRNHAYRVATVCAAHVSPDPVQLEKIAIAAAFHDLGIWTAGTFDYLDPSVRLARQHLSREGREAWTNEIDAMILEHHKLSMYSGDAGSLVEPFRRADWTDVSMGLLRFGLPRAFVRDLYAAWPSAGFHRRLVELELDRLRTHPLRPLPMVKL
jgi:hypothetical protein